MNRYTGLGLLVDALDGKKVLVLTDISPRFAFREVADLSATQAGFRVRAANGDEEVSVGTGWVKFQRFDQVRRLAVRMRPDTVLLDVKDPYDLDPDWDRLLRAEFGDVELVRQ